MTTDPLAEIRASFFIECDELMESLQDALMILDEEGGDAETINIVFRAVHSIKGGAGAFGFDRLVAFAHRFETVLDQLRAGKLMLTPEVTKLFIQGADLLHDHVRAAQTGGGEVPGAEALLTALEALMEDAPAEDEATDFTPAGLDFDFGGVEAIGGTDSETVWRIEFAPHAGLYASGNEPVLILRTLSALGRAEVTCHIPDDLSIAADEAELPRLRWTVRLQGDASHEDLTELFDFVADVTDLTITRDSDDLLKDCDQPMLGEGNGAGDDDAPLVLGSDSIVAAANEDRPAGERMVAPLAPVVPAEAGGDPPRPPVARSEAEPAAATVRVDLDRVDRLVNLVGELVINQAMLAQSVTEAGLGDNNSVMNGLEEFMMLTRDIQDGVMMIRAQSVKPLFQRMARIVREASAAVGKEVRLRTEGETTEIDKTVLERIADPLTHMIRNAIDHGVEHPDTRRAAGKLPEGTIMLSASHRAGRVLIEIADDGAGINRPRVRELAIAKGLIAADAELSDPEIDNLLFLPGFSTAKDVTALSGRGVGMDVVKSAITALGGRIGITSAPGSGTRFSISLPLTLAVLDGMVVRVAGQTLVVPLSAIVETATLSLDDIQRIGSSTEALHIRGDLVPLFDLGSRLGFRQNQGATADSVVILTTREDGARVALIVDQIMEQRQVVIKGLSRNYGPIPGVAAATILGDGQVALILDPSDLTGPALPPAGDDFALAG